MTNRADEALQLLKNANTALARMAGTHPTPVAHAMSAEVTAVAAVGIGLALLDIADAIRTRHEGDQA